MIRIEKAIKSDLASLEKLDRHISRESLAQCLKNGFLYTAKNGGQIIGILRYSLFWQTLPFLDLILLEETHRGKGIGHAMMIKWENDMRAKGYTDVLTSTQADETAFLFYEKLDYRKIGSFLPPGQDTEEWIYGKALPR